MNTENTNKKLKILIVHNYYQIPGGEDTVVENEKKLLEKYGHKVILYTRSNNEIKNMGLLGKVLVPFLFIYNNRTSKDIRKIIKEEKIDVVHVHNTLCLVSPSVYYAALKCKIPIVQTIHNFRMLCPGATFYRDGHICEDCLHKGLLCAVNHKCYRNSRTQTLLCVISTFLHRIAGVYSKINYICLTEFNRKKLLSLKQIQEERVFIKPNFANDPICSNKNKKKNMYIFVGRLDKLKGIDILIKAWKRFQNNKDIYSSKLVICGTGPMEEWCREYISNNMLNIEMKGFVSNKDVKNLISQSIALILPTQWYEGFPMTIVEAYSVGTPVICSAIGNCGDLVEEGITGWKFHSMDELIECIEKSTRINCTESVKRKFESLYTEKVNYLVLANIYRRCMLNEAKKNTFKDGKNFDTVL